MPGCDRSGRHWCQRGMSSSRRTIRSSIAWSCSPAVHPKRSYAIAGEIPGPVPDGMYISIDEPTRTLRSIPDGDRTLLMVGGEGHDTGNEEHTEARYENLERWASERFGMTKVEYRWSAQVMASRPT